MKKIQLKTTNTLVILLAIGLTGLIILSSTSKKAESISFDLSIAEDATPSVLEKVMSAKSGDLSEIVFEKGTYHFYPDKGFEKFVHISNHDDVRVSTAFPLSNFRDLTIDGRGSTFIFHGRMVPFLIDGSKGLQIKNLSIDWAETFHSEGNVVARDEANRTFDLRIDKTYPYEIRNEQLYFLKEYYEHSIGQSILYDPERVAIAFDTESYTGLSVYKNVDRSYGVDQINYKYKSDKNSPLLAKQGREYRLRAEELEPGLVRIHNHRRKIPPVGMILVCKGEKGLNRIAPAIRVTHSGDLKFTNVTVHHAGGMGLIAENSENITLDQFVVTPSNGRMVSTTADATHFVGCRGQITIKNCKFTNMLDDGSNIHGTYQEVMEVLGKRKLGVRIGHYQQQGFQLGKVGDEIGLVRLEDSFYPYEKINIESITPLNGRYHILTFDNDLPDGIQVGDLLENLNAYPELLVEDSYIGKNRARGLLISTPNKAVIRNNIFHTEMEAILVPVESGLWYESGSASDLLITNNKFQDCVHSGQNRGVIRFITDDENENIAFQNIEIIDNQFNHFDNLILEVYNTSGLVFRNNEITYSGTFPQLFSANSVVKIRSSEKLDFAQNKYGGQAKSHFNSDEDNEYKLQ